jgi:hypothetical protein
MFYLSGNGRNLFSGQIYSVFCRLLVLLQPPITLG